MSIFPKTVSKLNHDKAAIGGNFEIFKACKEWGAKDTEKIKRDTSKLKSNSFYGKMIDNISRPVSN